LLALAKGVREFVDSVDQIEPDLVLLDHTGASPVVFFAGRLHIGDIQERRDQALQVFHERSGAITVAGAFCPVDAALEVTF